jgi:hypothetical protein
MSSYVAIYFGVKRELEPAKIKNGDSNGFKWISPTNNG